jgi:hypothetical protein
MLYSSSYPSVSAVLSIIAKPELDRWKTKVGPEEAERVQKLSTQYGNSVHTSVVDGINKTKTPEMPKVAKAIEQWGSLNVQKWLGFEVTVASEEFGYFGSVDAIAELNDGSIAVIEFKTSKKIHDEHILQIAAYGGTSGFDQNTRLIILQLDQNTSEWVEHEIRGEEREEAFQVFLSAVNIWNWKKKRKSGSPAQ